MYFLIKMYLHVDPGFISIAKSCFLHHTGTGSIIQVQVASYRYRYMYYALLRGEPWTKLSVTNHRN